MQSQFRSSSVTCNQALWRLFLMTSAATCAAVFYLSFTNRPVVPLISSMKIWTTDQEHGTLHVNGSLNRAAMRKINQPKDNNPALRYATLDTSHSRQWKQLQNTTQVTPDPQWKQISQLDIDKRFELESSATCVDRAAHLVCPEIPRPARVGEITLKGCRTFVEPGDLKQVTDSLWPAATKPLYGDREYILPWEYELLKEPPLTDLKKLPDLRRSRIVKVSNPGSAALSSCTIGERIEFRADLIDGYGALRQHGGDDVRSWVVKGNATTPEDADHHSAAASVEDLKNGSYRILATCLWPGISQLKVGVAYPREYLRAVTNQLRIHSMRTISARFARGGLVSLTMCSATPNLPYSCLCNLTTWNDQQSFYCGHPIHPQMSCSDLESVRSLWFRSPVNVTVAETLMMEQMSRSAESTTINQSVLINASNASLPKLPKCSEVPFSATWTTPIPSGYWIPGKKWKSLICEAPPTDNMAAIRCLQNTTVWIFGDSNGLTIYNQFINLTKCLDSSNARSWSFNQTCIDPITGTRILFFRHEYPLFLNHDSDTKVTEGGVADIMESIPSSGKQFIIGHYFNHLATYHMSAARARLLAFKHAVLKLLNRSSRVFVGLRGPHVIYKDWDVNHAAGGDVLISHYLPMVKDIFQSIQDRVVFLDGWEMTVAIENEHIHPLHQVPRSMMEFFLNLVCDRSR